MIGEQYRTKYSADKLALLGLFVIALLSAYLIVITRSAVVLSGPIKLDYAGLSVSMPSGNGWQTETHWRKYANGFILRAVFSPGTGTPGALADCRYLLAAAESDPYTRFEHKAELTKGSIVQTDQIQTDMLTIDSVHIQGPQAMWDTFFGTAKLPNNQQLDIEVRQAIGDKDLAEQAFNRIIQSLEFEDNQL